MPPEPTQRSSRTCKTPPAAHELGRVATSELTQVARCQPSESEVLDGMECDCGDCEQSHPDPTVDACMQTHNLSQVLAERACQETQLPHIGMITVSCLVVLLLIGMFQLKRYHQKWWRDLVHHAFLEVDLDKSGQINEHELHAALLHLYWQLPVRCPPPSKLATHVLLCQLDKDGSGDLDLDEFQMLCKHLAARKAAGFKHAVHPV